MSRVSERDRASRKKREERDWETSEDSHVRDLEAERDRKKHRHHYDDDERRHERHRESDRRRRSVEDATLEPDLRPRNRSPDQYRDSVEHRNRSRGDSPSDTVVIDGDVDRRHRRSTKENLENGGVHKHERSSNLVGKLVEREGFSHEESAERRHRKRKDYRESDEEEIQNNNGKRTRVSDVDHRKSTKRVNDRDLGDVSVQSADNKVESRKENLCKDRRKERAIVMDEEMKYMQKKEKEANGSSRHDKKSRDNAELDEKLVADEENVTLKKERRFKDEINEEKMERSVVAKPPVSSDNSMVALQKVELADANCDGSSVFPPSGGSLANTLAEEPFTTASKVSQASSNSHSRHTKVITAINENEGVSIIRSDEVTGKSSTDGTTSSVAGKSGSLSRDALAKAKKALQMKKELSEKLKKIPVLNKQQPSAGIHDSSHRESKYPSNSAASGPIVSSISLAPSSSMPENASAAGVKGVLSVSAASYEAVKRAQEFAKIWHHQDPDFTPLMNMFPGSSAADIGTLPKSTKVPVLRLDAQGREIDEHGNVVNKPKVTNLSTLKVNINKQKKEAFQILRPELDTDMESTHFDARMGVNKTKLMRPKRSSFQFVEEGKWSKQAEVMKIKNQFGEAQAKELKAKQSQLLKAKAEPDDNPNLIAVGERTFKEKKKDEVPEIEWWDKPFLPSGGTYNDISEENLNLEKITIYMEHPRPIEPPAEPTPPLPQPLKLTKKEQKKLRTQRRLAKERDRQEMIRQGLIEPPKPKIKMSNLMKVLSSEATQDPTRLEKEVRAAALEREQAHMDRNIARKLTPQERREKKERKLFDDPSVPETLVSVYRINDLSHPQTRFKVDVNAQENRLTGCAVMSDGLSVVVVEGVRKSIKRYSKLMLKRINWAAAVGDDGDGGDNNNNVDEIREASCPNKCVLVWQGSAAKPSFNRFFVHQCRSDATARKVLADAGVPHYWDLAVNFSDELL